MTSAAAILLQAIAPPRTSRAEVAIARRAMACDFSITLPGETRRAVDRGIAALDEVDRVEDLLSVYRTDSAISRLNAGETVTCPELYGILREACRLSRLTGRAFDPAAGALSRVWGFLHPPHRVPPPAELADALARSGSHQVVFDDPRHAVTFATPGVEFNLGAFGKGYAIDRALQPLRSAFMQGGRSSIKGVGAPPRDARGWQVVLADPEDDRRPLARLWLRDRAIGTSGDAYQFFVAGGDRYGHILDPRTGRPPCRLASASAICHSAAQADALSTAFYVMGVDGTRDFLRRHPDVGAVLVRPLAECKGPRVVVLGAARVEVLS